MLPPVDLAGFLALQQASKPSGNAKPVFPVRVDPSRRVRVRPRLDVVGRFLRWRRRRASRIVLSALDDRTLRDIGVNRGEIEAAVRSVERLTLR
jgi:uncharacterized protein YjiS (DUF1127 family)